MIYPDTQRLIDGRWRDGSGDALPVRNPATGEIVGQLAHAGPEDLGGTEAMDTKLVTQAV